LLELEDPHKNFTRKKTEQRALTPKALRSSASGTSSFTNGDENSFRDFAEALI